MRLAVISHKVCWHSPRSASEFVTDGGFPAQMAAIADLFSETVLVVPCQRKENLSGVSPIIGKNLKFRPLPKPKGTGFWRKLGMLGWFIANSKTVWNEIRNADAVHAPVPGDVGTVGMVFALVQRKPLFVRYCGNWLVQRTVAEKLWRRGMEYFAGGRNVMLATGGANEPPSKHSPAVKWIFSTSLREKDLPQVNPKRLENPAALKLIIVCRQEKRKGTELVIESLPQILKRLPQATLDVVGGGAELENFKELARNLGLENKVRFHGKVKPDDVLKLLQEADLFCYPTVSEGFPKVVLEALACGLPVLTTPVSVLPNLINQGGGRLLNQTSAAAVAEAVLEICENPEMYHQMSSSALQTARQYTLERWRDEINQTLCEAWGVTSLAE
jgi:hypothetical protein